MNRWVARIKHSVGAAAVAGALLVSPAASQAGTIYTEGINGDLGSDLPSSTNLLLEFGTSTIFGSSSWCAFQSEGNCEVDNDRDSFAVTVPDGGVLTSITLTRDFILFDDGGASWTMSFYDGNDVDIANLLASQGVTFDEVVSSLFAGALPLGPGVYGIRQTPGSAGELGFAMTYRWDFTVEQASPVPEPTSLALLGLGLIGVVAAQRRRARR